MKKIHVNSLLKINGGSAPPGCGTVGALTVFTSFSGGFGLISGSYWRSLWSVCENMG